MSAKLTAKQLAFCREYVKDRNATQAAIRSGYSKKTAYSQGERLLRNVEVAKLMTLKEKSLAEKAGVKAENVITEYKDIAFSNFLELLESGETSFVFKSVADIPKKMGKLIESISVRQGKYGESVTVKLVSKISALDALSRHLGLFEKDNNQKPPTVVNVQPPVVLNINRDSNTFTSRTIDITPIEP